MARARPISATELLGLPTLEPSEEINRRYRILEDVVLLAGEHARINHWGGDEASKPVQAFHPGWRYTIMMASRYPSLADLFFLSNPRSEGPLADVDYVAEQLQGRKGLQAVWQKNIPTAADIEGWFAHHIQERPIDAGKKEEIGSAILADARQTRFEINACLDIMIKLSLAHIHIPEELAMLTTGASYEQLRALGRDRRITVNYAGRDGIQTFLLGEIYAVAQNPLWLTSSPSSQRK